ncbi:diphthine synthase [Metallosphaera tengchongensis]|uniref:Diphthine synthase n=1 Tax=Metallosphaera tengchongensis TaxID=1532350 RepID=A0A6N0NRJ5_9CREN|nr:diphthine synthase [Metallosphaera tengchongensis]QKQ99375.1 diphthine synthase [Metallosphaera tengchongensis]
MANIYFVGLGPSKMFLTKASIEAMRNADLIMLDKYTSITCDLTAEALTEITGRPVILADRNLLENRQREIIKHLDEGRNVAVVTVGDPMIATTHVSLAIEARKKGHDLKVIPGISVHCYVISKSMLSSYKFGRSVTVTFPVLGKLDPTPYRVIKANREQGLHTILYLDLKEDAVMTAEVALNYLLQLEKEIGEGVLTHEDWIVVGERLGCPDERVRAMKIKAAKMEKFGEPPHIIIVPSRNLYEMEVEALKCLV